MNQNIVVDPPYFKNVQPNAKYVGSDTCASCHTDHAKNFEKSAHARIELKGVEGVHGTTCESCHGPGSLHVAGGGDKTKILTLKKDNESCFQCHIDQKAQFNLQYHHPIQEGKMTCTSCHDPHGPDAKPWSAVSIRGTNDVCVSCHRDKKGPFTWEHEALSSSCTECHNPHGSIHPKLLVQNDLNLCLKCHVQPNWPTVGKRSHSAFAPRGNCWSAGCHTQVHGSNFDDHLRY